MTCRCMFQRPIRSSAVASRGLLQSSKAVRASFGGAVAKVPARHLFGRHPLCLSQHQRCFTKLTDSDTSSIINTVPSFRDKNVYQSERYFLPIFLLIKYQAEEESSLIFNLRHFAQYTLRAETFAGRKFREKKKSRN